LPWLLTNLATAFVAASVVGYFNNVVKALPALAAWMTMISGMGGNTGTQALAVTRAPAGARTDPCKCVSFGSWGRRSWSV
jgi:Mg/Co/Ni transporter MgtE